MEKYKNKYRITSARAPFWDYRWNAAYFVTICTQNRVCWFGKIETRGDTWSCVHLSEIGEIINAEWLKTFEMRPDMNLWRGEYVVMPNHFHAIIGIGENEYNASRGAKRGMDSGSQWEMQRRSHSGSQRETQRGTQRRDAMHCVSTTNLDSTDTTDTTDTMGTTNTTDPTSVTIPKNQFGPQSKNLASIIRGFKIGVTRKARQINPDFAWQSRYHDHIIRNEESFQNISEYIINNPANWQEDKFLNAL